MSNSVGRGGSAAAAAGAEVISGFDLFFRRGIHAFQIFTGGKPTGRDALRQTLLEAAKTVVA